MKKYRFYRTRVRVDSRNCLIMPRCLILPRITLSKPFDCLMHNLLIANLHACGFDMPSLKLVCSYLSKENKELRLMTNSVLRRSYFWCSSGV